MERAIEFAKSITAADGADIHIYTDSLDRATFSEGESAIAWTIHGSDEKLKSMSPSINSEQSRHRKEPKPLLRITNDSDR